MKKYVVHIENPYKFKDEWTCGACCDHVEFAKKNNMLLLVDESGDVQGVTFNHVLGREVKDIVLNHSLEG